MTTADSPTESRIRTVLALEGRDLAAEVLVNVLGWRWYARPSPFRPLEQVQVAKMRVALYPPENSDWERFNFDPAFVDVTGAESQYERFIDWNKCTGLRYIGRDDFERFGIPRPDEDARDAALVLKELERRGVMERYVRILWAFVAPGTKGIAEASYVEYLMLRNCGPTVLREENIGRLLLASPMDICRAALLAVWCPEGNGKT